MPSRIRSTDILSTKALLEAVARAEAEEAITTRLPPIRIQQVIMDLPKAIRLATTLTIQVRT